MKYLSLFFINVLLFTALMAGPIYAQSTPPSTAETTGLSFDPHESDESLGSSEEEVNLGQEAPLTVAGNIINIALGLLGLIFLVLTIYAGFIWMTAHGNEEQITKAKKILQAAIIGIVIVLASYGISRFVFTQIAQQTVDIGD